ncbi:MAG: electron transport complex subunit RsxC [Planctomycetes bacterium]|nr:electron transport complex subunit RsxC [Planctomycetota bacterium]
MPTIPLNFRHGVHPPELKELTAGRQLRRLPYPDELVLPLRQHTGKPARPIVRVGDRVMRGDKVAEADGWVSVPLHASASGIISAIGLWPHPDGSLAPAIRIAVERYSLHETRARVIPDWRGLSKEQLVAAVREAGVVGLGGAAFPTHVKLVPPEGEHVDYLLVNGCECEPYLTTDDRTMVEYPERVQLGIRIMMKCLGARHCLVGIEKNKPEAIRAIQRTLPDDLDVLVMPLRVRYPQGAEKMLIKALIDREVPPGKLPVHVGAVVQNVGSVATIAEAFETGLPLLERIVTVTGDGVRRPGNLLVPVGTKLRDLLDACGGLTPGARKIVLGGPMMGAAVSDLNVPVCKGTTGVVVLDDRHSRSVEILPCIRCGHCLDACPVFLNPQLLGALARAGRHEQMEEHDLATCMLCGCCSYVCPSNIPLSQMFQVSKAALTKIKAARS